MSARVNKQKTEIERERENQKERKGERERHTRAMGGSSKVKVMPLLLHIEW